MQQRMTHAVDATKDSDDLVIVLREEGNLTRGVQLRQVQLAGARLDVPHGPAVNHVLSVLGNERQAQLHDHRQVVGSRRAHVHRRTRPGAHV